MYATGGNRAASRLAGIRVQRQVMLAFVISGVLGSVAGVVYTARQGSLTPLFGTAFLLPVFAACFLGSVTLTRRKFHILGTVLGVYLIETGTNGLLILGAPAYTQQLFAGAVLILATIGARYRTVGFRLPARSATKQPRESDAERSEKRPRQHYQIALFAAVDIFAACPHSALEKDIKHELVVIDMAAGAQKPEYYSRLIRTGAYRRSKGPDRALQSTSRISRLAQARAFALPQGARAGVGRYAHELRPRVHPLAGAFSS
jgi:hypothetical protein